MIETYAFLAMFVVQILALAVLHTVGLVKLIRTTIAALPDNYFTKVSPDVGRNLGAKRFAISYRTAHAVITVLGLLLLGWLFNYMRRPDWGVGTASVLSVVYFLLTFLPMTLLGLLAVFYALARRDFKAFGNLSPKGKRKAFLQRRGLFDFVSPFTVWIAVALYFLFVAFSIYVQLKPFAAIFYIGGVTLLYALSAFELYSSLYGKKWNPNETHAGHVHRIGFLVRASVYGCIASVAILSFFVTIGRLDLDRWLPFGLSASFVITTLEMYRACTVLSRKPEADALGESPVFNKVSP